MKKGILLLAAIATFGMVNAQTLVENSAARGKDLGPTVAESRADLFSASARRDLNAEWYIPINAFTNSTGGAGFDRFVRFLMPDSNGFYLTDNNGTVANLNVGTHSAGDAIDAKDEIWNFTNPVNNRLSRYNSYTIDSLFFQGGYIRNLDSMLVNNVMTKVVDTLIIQVYEPSALAFAGFVAPNEEIHASPTDMDHNTGLGNGASQTIRIPLDENDSSTVGDGGWRTRNFQVPTNVNVTANNINDRMTVAAYSVLFKPMKTVNLGDTLFDAWNNQFPNITDNITNKNNYFVLSYYVNNGTKIEQLNYYNNYFICPSWLRYGQSTNGWTDYVVGNAYANTLYGIYGMHLTTQTLDVKDIDASGYGLGDAYPNPAGTSDDINIDFELGAGSDVVITVSDIAGKVVRTLGDHYGQGLNTVSFQASDLNSGVYMYSIEAGNFKATKKFIIQ
jgi:hypothetical protein